MVGEDPTRPEHARQMMYRQHFWHGNGIIRSTAIAGIDIAPGTLSAKSRTCRKLWAVRPRLRPHPLAPRRRADGDFYETPVDNAAFRRPCPPAVADGYTAFKSTAVPSTMPIEGQKPVRAAAAAVEAMREAVGPDIDIMVDCPPARLQRWDSSSAKRSNPITSISSRSPAGRRALRAGMINRALTTPWPLASE